MRRHFALAVRSFVAPLLRSCSGDTVPALKAASGIGGYGQITECWSELSRRPYLTRAIQVMTLVAGGACVSGCGSYVPELQEFPGRSIDRQQFVKAIVTNVNCEIRDAVNALYDQEPSNFLDGWGIQTTLMLSVDEKTEVTPNINWIPSGVFNLTAGVDLSANATREDTLNSFLLVDNIKHHSCSPAARTNGLFLMQSDLKLRQWLFDAYTASATSAAEFGGVKDTVLTHHVKFEINSGGNVTPTYKLTKIEFNPSGTLLSVNRNRTQDLIITLGPADHETVAKLSNGKKQNVVVAVPSSRAEFQHLSFTIGAAVSQGVKSGLGQ